MPLSKKNSDLKIAKAKLDEKKESSRKYKLDEKKASSRKKMQADKKAADRNLQSKKGAKSSVKKPRVGGTGVALPPKARKTMRKK